MAEAKRGWFAFFVDRAISWWIGLPGETYSYTVQPLRIPVATKNGLAANLYRPKISKPKGTIVIRTPFGIGPMMCLGHARLFAPRGYQVLVAACRGTDPSDGGKLEFASNEAVDGKATIEWMRKQSWYTGSFAMFGGSYLGYTQWAVLASHPADMKAAVIVSGPMDFGEFAYSTGALDAHIIAWADIMTCHERGVKFGPGYVKKQKKTMEPVYSAVPQMDAIDAHFKGTAPEWMKYIVTHPDLSDPFYKPMDQSTALDSAKIPILQTTGWNDVVLPLVMKQHNKLIEHGFPASLTMFDGSHLGVQRGAGIVEGFKYIEEHLGGVTNEKRSHPIRTYVTGAKEWRNFASWPPKASRQSFFLCSKKTLSSKRPTETSKSVFKFDPATPTPDIGLARPFDDMAPTSYDDTALAERNDVAVFTSEPLKSDLEVCGQPQVTLHHTTDNPHADLLVKLSRVATNGNSTRLSDRYMRLDTKRASEVLTISLSDIAHKFSRGDRIRVIVAGGAHPAYIRNLGTGENQATGANMQSVIHTVHHSADMISELSLPVVA